MPKVTEKLHKTWKWKRLCALDNREYDQSGRKRSQEDLDIFDFDIAVQDYLIALPIGAMFDAREVYALVEKERTQ